VADIFDKVIAEDIFDKVAAEMNKQPQTPSQRIAKTISPVFGKTKERQFPKNSAQWVKRIAEDTSETMRPPMTKESVSRFLNPNAGSYGVSRTMEDVGQNLPRSLGMLSPSEMQKNLGIDVLTAGIGAAAKPVLSPVGKLIADTMESASGLEYKTPGVLKAIYKDPKLLFAKSKKAVDQMFKAAKGTSSATNELTQELFKTEEIIARARELLNKGQLSAAEAHTARKAVDRLFGKPGYEKEALIKFRAMFDDVVKANKLYASADKAYSRAVKADAVRKLLPVNKGGGTSIFKSTVGTALAAIPGGKVFAPLLLSPIVQGSVAALAGLPGKSPYSKQVGSVALNILRKKLSEQRNKTQQ